QVHRVQDCEHLITDARCLLSLRLHSIRSGVLPRSLRAHFAAHTSPASPVAAGYQVPDSDSTAALYALLLRRIVRPTIIQQRDDARRLGMQGRKGSVRYPTAKAGGL